MIEAPPSIHPTAIVSDDAVLEAGVEVGPYCVIEGPVRLGEGVHLRPHVVLTGPITIGAGTSVGSFATLGAPPQDFKFGPDSPTAGVVIGKNCKIREYVSVHAATNAQSPTTLGDNVFMMATSHVGHDCRVGNNVVIVNGAALSGHCEVGDRANLSGHTGVHQFCRIGRLAMLSGGVSVGMDVPPFCIADERNRLGRVNLIGLRRSGMDPNEIDAVRRAFRELLRGSTSREELLGELRERGREAPALTEMADFIEGSKRGICPAGRAPRMSDPG
ncbi:MAG: acyl-ACP--UDP-N-acetylglucosamine O-acyltransferase [Phycisphaerales bacterium]